MENRTYIRDTEIAEVTDAMMEAWEACEFREHNALAHQILLAGFELVKFWEEEGLSGFPLTDEQDVVRKRLARKFNRWIHEAINICQLEESGLKGVQV